eukprot:1701867-Rhodomonas_salina.1
METMALEDLVAFLSHRSRLVRKGAVAAAAGLSGTKAGRVVLIEKKPDALTTLIGWASSLSSHPFAVCCPELTRRGTQDDWQQGLGGHPWLCLRACYDTRTETAHTWWHQEAVINISKLGAGPKIMQKILDDSEGGSNLDAASKLLANVSRVAHGRRELIGYVSDGTGEERKKQMKELIGVFEKSLSKAGDPLAPLALFFENVASEPQGAKLLCDDEEGFALASIAKGLAGLVSATGIKCKQPAFRQR